MDIPHNFRFKWNDHVPHLSQVFSELRFEEVYCDTTLITEDGFIMKAHGAVLITTSRYFERVLSDVTPEQHPIIVLKGINYEELSYLLDYIYQGVTQVDQHMMESVLDVADLLEIKGLSKMKNNLSLKKLLAPSVMTVAAARDSPSCSSTSKSPSPLPLQSPNTPSSDVYVQSFSLKTDHEDMNEDVAYESPQNRHNHIENLVGTERTFDADYVASTSSKHAVVSTEYLDQNLGIDLSLSRGSCEENGKTSGKISNTQEETPLRKRKIMHTEDGISTSEINFSKYEGKMSDGLILHQKKKVFSKDSVNNDEPQEDLITKTNNECSMPDELYGENFSEFGDEDFYSDFDSERIEHFELQNFKIGSENTVKKESKVIKSDIMNKKCSYTMQSIDVPSTSGRNLNITEREILLPRSNLEQKFAREDPLFIPESSENFLKVGESEKLFSKISTFQNKKICASKSIVDESEDDELESSFISQLGRNPMPHSSQYSVNLSTDCDISNYVAVRVFESEKFGTNTTKVDDKTQEIFKELGQRVQRQPSKVKRPLSMYTLFLKEKYSEVAEQNPSKKGPEIIKILSSLWKNLPSDQKAYWKEKANALLKDFKIQNPDYIYCPKKAQDEKFEYYRRRVERRNLFKINPYIPKF